MPKVTMVQHITYRSLIGSGRRNGMKMSWVPDSVIGDRSETSVNCSYTSEMRRCILLRRTPR